MQTDRHTQTDTHTHEDSHTDTQMKTATQTDTCRQTHGLTHTAVRHTHTQSHRRMIEIRGQMAGKAQKPLKTHQAILRV